MTKLITTTHGSAGSLLPDRTEICSLDTGDFFVDSSFEHFAERYIRLNLGDCPRIRNEKGQLKYPALNLTHRRVCYFEPEDMVYPIKEAALHLYFD